ncbi:uncharacterized protein LOC100212370 [Hydra vulgaris]|uniref:uncharacterized protein LOC100212370 n=1 Tax=Hydra vulgaris TaxID=6087 RepID=UPI0001927518|nr:universal stress protein A-like protein [Hydra vulgaris]
MDSVGKVNCIAVDGSESSKHAFNWYLENFHNNNDTLVILHVTEIPRMALMGLMGAYASIDIYQDVVESNAREDEHMMQYYSDICKEKHIKYNSIIVENCYGVGHDICDSVKKCHGTVIILGQRGLGKFSRFVLGSTSDYVLHHSNIPVIVVPDAKPSES